jgi:hypothetical protein
MRCSGRPTTSTGGRAARARGFVALALACCAFCGSLAVDAVAHAQRAPRRAPQADASAPTERARQLFERGIASLAEQRWDEARVLFEEAWALSPRPSILVNLGTAQRQSGRLVEARESYRTFLERFATHELAAATRTSLAEVDALIPHLTIHVEGLREGDEVFLDDQRVTTLARSFPANPGLRQVSLWRGGRVLQSVRVRVELEGNEEVFLRAIDLGPGDSPVTRTPTPGTPPPAGGTQDLTGLADVDWSGATPTNAAAASRDRGTGATASAPAGAGGAGSGTPILASPTAPRRDPPAEASSGGGNTGLIVGIVVGAVAVVAGGVVLGVLLASPEDPRQAVSPTIRAGVLTFQ